MSQDKPKTSGGSTLAAIFDNPVQLRLVLTALLLLVWWFGVQAPLSGTIEERAAKSGSERRRVALANEIDLLRRENARVAGRLPTASDQNEWIAFLMDRVRSTSLKLASLEPRPPAPVGPYQIVSFRMSVEGPHAELERFLRDLETSPRLIRIESVKIAPKIEDASARAASGGDALEMHLSVLGVVDPAPAEKAKEKASSKEKPNSKTKVEDAADRKAAPKGSEPRT